MRITGNTFTHKDIRGFLLGRLSDASAPVQTVEGA
jgi:hypothetical protein